jgi:anti-anti-sigma factor
MPLRMVSMESDGCVRVSASAPLTALNLLNLSAPNPLAALLGADWSSRHILLDMTEAAYIDSCAVGWLIECQRELETGGGRMALFGLQPRVQRLLRILRLDAVLPLAGSEPAARQVLAEALARPSDKHRGAHAA